MITVNSIKERREAVTAINDYDNRTGGLKSQRAKYEKPLWWYNTENRQMVANVVIEVAKKVNPRFNENKFLKDCGLISEG
jgi:major membrane immunogen (membrane-anchored lipoprotein)